MAKRAKGEGSLRKRNDGRWEGIYYTGEIKDGKRVRKSVFAKSQAECKEKLKKAIDENEQAQQILNRCAYLNSSEPTMREWYGIWLESFCKPTVKEHTVLGYQFLFETYILPRIGGMKLNQISTVVCQQVLTDLFQDGRTRGRSTRGNGLSAKTVKDINIALKACLQKAVDEEIIQKNPAVKVQLPKEEKKEMQTLSANDLGAFLRETKESGCYEFYLLELTTGLRLGEILALTWDDFNEEEKTITVNKQVQRINSELKVSSPKTEASHRTIRICDECVQNLILLKSRQARIDTRLIFPSPVTHDVRDPSSVTRNLHRIQRRAGVPQIRFHDLRHTFATLSIEQGQDIKTISHMLGHTDAGFTMNTYMHVTEKMQDSVASALGNLMTEKQNEKPAKKIVRMPA